MICPSGKLFKYLAVVCSRVNQSDELYSLRHLWLSKLIHQEIYPKGLL